MTGRRNTSSFSYSPTQCSNSTIESQKQTRQQPGQYNSPPSFAKCKNKASGHSSIDLKEALHCARKSFEKGLRSNISDRKRPISCHNESSGVSTRSSSSISYQSNSPNSRNSKLSPNKKSPKKSSSAPASPTKPCKIESDASPTRPLLRKRIKLDEITGDESQRLISRSELLLIKTEDMQKQATHNSKGNITPLDFESPEIKLHTSTYKKSRRSPKDVNISNSGASIITRSTSPTEELENVNSCDNISLCSMLDSTLDTSLQSDRTPLSNMNATNEAIFGSSTILDNTQMAKSPNRMFLSASKRISSTNLNKNKAVSMNEVIKLHQDEGVLHLLHGLPSSRRSRAVSATVVRRRASSEFPQANAQNQAQKSSLVGRPVGRDAIKNTKLSTTGCIPGLVRKSISAGYGPIQHRPQPYHSQNSNSLSSPLSNIKPCNIEELMKHDNLELLKKLDSKTYTKLWSSSSRYILKDQNLQLPGINPSTNALYREEIISHGSFHPTLEDNREDHGYDKTTLSGGLLIDDIAVANHNRIDNEQSSKATFAQRSANLPQVSTSGAAKKDRKISLVTKHLKDILIRSYPSFVQIILSPLTTGLKHTLNANVCDEVIDILKQLVTTDECKAVLISGIGQNFCKGVDLSILTYDAPEKQRKSAETLANSIKRLVKFLVSYPKILVAAVNGHASGLGVAILSFFDIVFASDKATFCLETYSKLGQIPEAFASHTFIPHNRACLSEILLFGKKMTAAEAKDIGIVSSVIWPEKFIESIVPRMEMLESRPSEGLRTVQSYLKPRMSPSIMDEETKELIRNWTTANFAKKVRQYIKINSLNFQ